MILYPDPFLTKVVPKSTSVDCKDIFKMFDVMKKYKAIGLAANQIGINERVIIIEPYWVFINPVITKSKNIVQVVEQCLSIPGQGFKVNRASTIEMECQTSKFKPCRYEFQGIQAYIIQHEIDHLNGILINEIYV